MMRSALRRFLVDSIAGISGRVFEPNGPDKDTEAPFLVVRDATEEDGADWYGLSSLMEIWPHEKSSFKSVDTLVQAVSNAVQLARFSDADGSYMVQYVGGEGEDLIDKEWDLVTRGIRVRVFNLGWMSGLTYAPDPVTAIRNWTKAKWPSAHTDPATWTPADATPGIYWRLVDLSVSERLNWGSWLGAQLRAHVIAPSPTVRLQYVRRLAEALALATQTSMSDGGPLLLDTYGTDTNADPMRDGQVRLSARFGVLLTEPVVQPINHATLKVAGTANVVVEVN